VRNQRLKAPQESRQLQSGGCGLGSSAYRHGGCVVPGTPGSGDVAGLEAAVKVCGVAAAMLQGHSWAPTPLNGSKVNVGTIPGVPGPACCQRAGGKARRRLTRPGWGGGPVVVRGRESRLLGEGVQRDRSNWSMNSSKPPTTGNCPASSAATAGSTCCCSTSWATSKSTPAAPSCCSRSSPNARNAPASASAPICPSAMGPGPGRQHRCCSTLGSAVAPIRRHRHHRRLLPPSRPPSPHRQPPTHHPRISRSTGHQVANFADRDWGTPVSVITAGAETDSTCRAAGSGPGVPGVDARV